MHALRFELTVLRRNRSRMLALAAFAAIGLLAVYVGQQQVQQWQNAIAISSHSQTDSITEALAYLSSGEPGPAARPWVDLTQPLWQDRYADTRVAREPSALAGIAAGAVDPTPVVFTLHRLADPLAAAGAQIENPELAAGMVDLVLVLGLLLPLLIGVLGIDVGSQERESGLDRMIIVQAGSMHRWLIFRMFAVTMIAAACAVSLCLVASLAGKAQPAESMWLIGFAAVMSALWGGLLLAINAISRSVRGSAFAYGVLWTGLCVILPALAAQIGLDRVQADFAVTETLQVRDLRYAAYAQELETILPTFYANHPELADLPAATEQPLAADVARHVYDALQLANVRSRHAQRVQEERQAQLITERAAWLSPTIALALGLERLAAVGTEAASAFRGYLVMAVDERVRWLLDKAWHQQPLSENDFTALIATSPVNFKPVPGEFLRPMLILTLWALLAWLLAYAAVVRQERHTVAT